MIVLSDSVEQAYCRIIPSVHDMTQLEVMPCTDQFGLDADLHDAKHIRMQSNLDCEALRWEATLIFRSICHCKAE